VESQAGTVYSYDSHNIMLTLRLNNSSYRVTNREMKLVSLRWPGSYSLTGLLDWPRVVAPSKLYAHWPCQFINQASKQVPSSIYNETDIDLQLADPSGQYMPVTVCCVMMKDGDCSAVT